MTKEEEQVLSFLMTIAEYLNTDTISDETMQIHFTEGKVTH